MTKILQKYLLLFSIAILTQQCGSGGGKSGGKAPAPNLTEAMFKNAAETHQIPMKIIQTVGLHSSNLNTAPSSAPYFQVAGDSTLRSLGFQMSETAFGVSASTLGIKGADAKKLDVQVNAYAKWLAKNLKSIPGLKANPVSSNDTFLWLWEISRLQVSSDRNIRGIWVRDLMKLMSEGRVWQHSGSSDTLTLAPSPIDEASLDPQFQALLRLDDDLSDINSARRLELVSEGINTLENSPRRVHVIHCPLSLAACLAIQDQSTESIVRLGAHYIIPQDETLVPRPIQIQDHERRVQITSADGTVKDINDAVIVMLVGNSGRYVEGVRTTADPTWFTPWQLKKLGSVIKGICSNLSQRYAEVSMSRCTSTSDPRDGVLFYQRGDRPTYRWGEIPDFEKSLFATYVRNTDANVQSEVNFEVPDRPFPAGSDIVMNTRFSPRTSWIRLQRAVRCVDQQLVWDTVRTDPIRGQLTWPLRISIWDSGPNGNGQQFMRVLVYGEKNELLGWSIKKIQLTNFDPEFNPPSEACL
jgi:hypothetical protein